MKAFRHSFLVDHSPQPSPAHQVNGPCGVEGQARPGSNWNGKPIHYAWGAKPFSLMVDSSKAYTRETIPLLSVFSLLFLPWPSQGLSNVPMHLFACFPGRKMFVLTTCPFVFSSFCPNAFGWGVGMSRAIEYLLRSEMTPSKRHIVKTRFYVFPYRHQPLLSDTIRFKVKHDTFHGFASGSSNAIRLHDVGLRSVRASDLKADIPSSAFTRFRRPASPEDN